MNLKELKEKRARLFADLETLRDATQGQTLSAEQQENWDKLMNDINAVDRDIAREEAYQEIRNRQAVEQQEQRTEQQTQEQQLEAFRSFMVTGQMTPEQRALLESRAGISGVANTNLVPTLINNAVEIALKQYSPMIAAVDSFTTTTGADLIWPTVNDTASKATIVAEYGQSTKDKKTFGGVTFKAYTLRTPIIPVSLELLQDSAVDIVATISTLLADSFGRGLLSYITSGTGSSQPKGLVAAAENMEAAAAAAISFDDLIGLMAKVDAAYQVNAKFAMNQNTLKDLMLLKDNQNRYLWQPSLTGQMPGTIYGHDIVLNSELANVGASAVPVLYGDFKKYKIRYVKGFTFVRLNELLAEWLSVGIMGYARIDGQLLDAGTHPVVKLTNKAE